MQEIVLLVCDMTIRLLPVLWTPPFPGNTVLQLLLIVSRDCSKNRRFSVTAPIAIDRKRVQTNISTD